MLISASELYGDRKYLLNTSGVVYRSIGSKVVKEMSDAILLDNLLSDPKLIKRPFLVVEANSFLIGFNDEKWSERLL